MSLAASPAWKPSEPSAAGYGELTTASLSFHSLTTDDDGLNSDDEDDVHHDTSSPNSLENENLLPTSSSHSLHVLPHLFLALLALLVVALVLLLALSRSLGLSPWLPTSLPFTSFPTSTPTSPSIFPWPPTSIEWPSNTSHSPLLPTSPPSIAFVLRSFHGHRHRIAHLLHSMQLFLPSTVLNDTLLVLDDSDADHSYAAISVPSWVHVRVEGRPPLSQTWQPSIKGAAYDQALYSNWMSDHYTEADIICTLDPDMAFVTRTALYSLMHWDATNGGWKPFLSCLGDKMAYYDSHTFFTMPSDFPHLPYCMSQLPVCLHRSTLQHVRDALTAQFRLKAPEMYQQFPLEDPFAVTYSLMTRASPHSDPICQFCLWSTFILSNATERSRYFVSIGATKEYSVDMMREWNANHSTQGVSMCPYPRAAAHVYYFQESGTRDSYDSVAEGQFLEGICKGVSEEVVDCLTPVCASKHYEEVQLPVWRWERKEPFASEAHREVCENFTRGEIDALYRWQWKHDSMEEYRQRACGTIRVSVGANDSLSVST